MKILLPVILQYRHEYVVTELSMKENNVTMKIQQVETVVVQPVRMRNQKFFCVEIQLLMNERNVIWVYEMVKYLP